MFCIFWSLYFVGLLSTVLVVYGHKEGCDFNQTLVVKEESTATFSVNFTHSGLLRLHMEMTSGYFRTPARNFSRSVVDFSTYSKGRQSTYFHDLTWKTRANVSFQCYSKDDICNVKIYLNNVSMEDNGTYRLIDRYFSEIACFTLFILQAPSHPLALVPRKKHHYLVSGDILPNITCKSECNPPCNITWGKYSKGNTLSLGAVTTDNTGEYTCTATGYDGKGVEQTISIYVAVRPSHHLVIVPEQIYYNLVAGDIMPDITCTSDCNQPCNISWGKHGRGDTLSLGAVTIESTGEYTCTARRSDGQNVKQSISVFVIDNSYFIHAIASLGTVQALSILVMGLIIFFMYNRRSRFSCHNCKHSDSKRNKPGDANVTFSQSTIQRSDNKNYEDLNDERRNINISYSEVNQALIENLAQSSANTYEL